MARRLGGRPARIGMVTPGKTTTSRSGRTGRCKGSLRTVLVVVSVIRSPYIREPTRRPRPEGPRLPRSLSCLGGTWVGLLVFQVRQESERSSLRAYLRGSHSTISCAIGPFSRPIEGRRSAGDRQGANRLS